jgi:predicted DNA-binding protein (UPF0251 family)
MSEQLLTVEQTAGRLGVSRRTFYNRLPNLRAKGLQVVKFGKRSMFREKSLNNLICRAAETENSLC